MGSEVKPKHIYQGDCPDAQAPESFDPDCPRCAYEREKDDELASLRARLEAAERERARLIARLQELEGGQ